MQVRLQRGLQEAQTGRRGAHFEQCDKDGRLGERVPHTGLDCIPGQ